MLVSVVIATYNRAGLLPDALRSVEAQRYRPIELIVVDDGSTDETPAVLDHWRTAHAEDQGLQLRVIRQSNAGVSAARNRGWRESRGEFIQFLDSDDKLHPDKLSRQVALFQSEPGVESAICQVAYADGRLESVVGVTGYQAAAVSDTLAFLCREDVCVHAPLHRRRMLAAVDGFADRLAFGEDVDLHLRMAILGARWALVPQALAYVRSHSGRSGLSGWARQCDGLFERDFHSRLIEFARQHGRDDARMRALVAARLRRLAWRYYAKRDALSGRICLETAHAISPDHPGIRARLYPLPGMGPLAMTAEWARHTAARIGRYGARRWQGRRAAEIEVRS
jgi:glycosyltransferase involved in cell wall biosynthesis